MGTARRSTALLASAAAVLAIVLPTHVQAATSAVNWEPESPLQSPPARTFAASAYDSKQNRVVLFGGRHGIGPLADTWQFDGTTWTNLAPAVAPPAASNAAIAYDPVREVSVLYGGSTDTAVSADTWEWDGAVWNHRSPATSPPPMSDAAMVYDSALGRIVLFGGFNAGVSPNTYANDTWELGAGVVTLSGNPQLSLSPTSGEFGSVDVGATSAAGVFYVTSSGTGPAVTQTSTTGDFAIVSTDCPSDPNPLATGSTCLVFLTFSPTAPGDRNGTMTFTGNLAAGSLVIPLHGFGIDRDFTISASPNTINVEAGSQQVNVAVTTTQIGDAGTILLSGLSNDPGIAASFNPPSIVAGAGSTATITIASSVIPGFYAIRLFGAEGAISRYAEISIQIFPVPDFSIAADSSAFAVAHGSSVQVAIDTTAINGVLSISPSASASPAGPTLSFSQPFITAGGVGILTIGAGFGVAPGQYTVTVTGIAGSITHSTTVVVTVTRKGLVNGGFETGDLTGWSATGPVMVINYPHSGIYGAEVGSPGSPTPTVGDSVLTQTFDVPASASKLAFWYWDFCNDKVKNDWFTVTLQDGVTGGAITVLPPVCVKQGGWTKVTVNLSSHAGHYVTLTFRNHDDLVGSTESYALFDDVAAG